MKSCMDNVDESWDLENLWGISCSYIDIWLYYQVLNERLEVLIVDFLYKVEYMTEETDIFEFTNTNVLLSIRMSRIFKVNYRLQFA
jgi:hypothetical protein